MLKEFLLQWCQDQYENSCAGKCGRSCDNHEYCKGICDAPGGCLDQVHWFPNIPGRADYSCEHLLQRYVLDFTDRYESQIYTAMQNIDLTRYDRYNILSLGCGGAPDLMAFEEMTKRTGKEIYYNGFDKNPKWKSIHDVIMHYFIGEAGMEINISQSDIFDVLKLPFFPTCQYNVIIIQYMLSHLYNTNQYQRIDELFEDLIDSVLMARYPKSPFLIIICDVDSMNKGRSNLFILLDKLEQRRFRGKAFARSHYPNGDLGKERWSYCKASPLFGNIQYIYMKNDSEHDGAQLVIELE